MVKLELIVLEQVADPELTLSVSATVAEVLPLQVSPLPNLPCKYWRIDWVPVQYAELAEQAVEHVVPEGSAEVTPVTFEVVSEPLTTSQLANEGLLPQ
jgi:hypothetical protein